MWKILVFYFNVMRLLNCYNDPNFGKIIIKFIRVEFNDIYSQVKVVIADKWIQQV